MTLLADPSKIQIGNDQYVLCHGDSLCTADVGYQIFRAWVRKPWIQRCFLRLPLEWRRSIANHLRSKSAIAYQRAERFSPAKNQAKMNVTTAANAAVLRDQAGDKLIHGHTHLPAHHRESLGEQTWQRWVLSDWDLDHPQTRMPKASALLIDSSGVRYLDLTI